MATYIMPHFGPLDHTSLDEYYDTETDFNGTKIQIDLNFGNKTIDPEKLAIVKDFIDNIRIHDINNRKYIDNDYNEDEGDTVKFYVQHHLEDLGENELTTLIDINSKSSEHEKQLLKKIHLVRVGIYPEGEDQFAIFDYSIGQEITNYLIVINTDENGNLDYMTMES
ncbi:MAG: DUF2004 domain-containing protein [Chitinophagaceae bacterium]|nr:DUF2004 domain-containing protein [Chitinophagaceae bacterium]